MERIDAGLPVEPIKQKLPRFNFRKYFNPDSKPEELLIPDEIK